MLTNYFHIMKVTHSIVVAQQLKITLQNLVYLFDLKQLSVEIPYNVFICYKIHVCDCTNQEKTT